jgi:hypothetical protein
MKNWLALIRAVSKVFFDATKLQKFLTLRTFNFSWQHLIVPFEFYIRAALA